MMRQSHSSAHMAMVAKTTEEAKAKAANPSESHRDEESEDGASKKTKKKKKKTKDPKFHANTFVDAEHGELLVENARIVDGGYVSHAV